MDRKIPEERGGETWNVRTFPEWMGVRCPDGAPRADDAWYTRMDGKVYVFSEDSCFGDAFDALDSPAYQEAVCRGADGGWGGARYFPPDVLRTLNGFQAVWQDDMNRYSTAARRPAFRMCGKPVTPEQADAIRTTGTYETILWRDWVHEDGRIGLDSYTMTKYPDAGFLFLNGMFLLHDFPFLNAVFVFWASSEGAAGYPETPECGMHIHDGRVELLCPRTAWERFCLYHRKYGGRDLPDKNQEW